YHTPKVGSWHSWWSAANLGPSAISCRHSCPTLLQYMPCLCVSPMSNPSKDPATPAAAAIIETLKMIRTMLPPVTNWGGNRPGPRCQEIHHPSVESTKPTMNPASPPRQIDLSES